MRRQVLWSVLAVAAVTLLAALIAGAAIRRNLIAESEAELLRQAEATATLIGSSVRQNLPSAEGEDVAPVARTLEIAKAIGGHDFVEAGFVNAAAGRTRIDLPATPLLDSLGSDPPLDQVTATEIEGEPVLAYVRALPLGTRDNAKVLVAIGRTEPMLATNLLMRPMLISLGVGALLTVLLASLVAGRVGKRLDRLADASAAIAAGDFSVRAPETGSDDVTRLGAAFNDMAEQLEDGRRRERDFLMSVGHDLRTPLTTMRGYAEALDAGEIEADDLGRVGGVLRRQTDRLSRLVEDLTLLSRLEAREFTMRPEEVDLSAHVSGLIEGQSERADDLRVKLVPDLKEVGMIVVDPDRISQVVGNLLDNALRYTPEGGAVTVTLRQDADVVVLEVADNGPGIDREDLAHVFERLYVAQRYRPVRPEGSGLGLSIVNELVHALGGSIAVDSVLGSGTTVSVALPCRGDSGSSQHS
ncbi:MAG: HAMP domain-containing histidine kinase [bacterium]|nr:HAMP domain-containing histidine kinase [bacterium]